MPAAMKKRLRNAVAVSDDAQVEGIGQLVTYTHKDQDFPGSKVVRVWAKHGLDVNDLPEARQPVHVFESAVRKQETRKQTNAGKQAQVKVDRVSLDSKACVYQVTRQILDEQHEVIDHPPAMRVRFDKEFSALAFEALEASHYDALRNLEDAIRKDFDASAKKMPGQKIRNSIRGQILKLGGQNLRRKAGGLYFVPNDYSVRDDQGVWSTEPTMPVLDGLRGFVDELFGEDGDFYTIRLAGDEDEQEMVRKHTTLNLAETSREIMERAIQRVRGGQTQRGVRSDFLAKVINDRRMLQAAVERYDDLVTLNMDEVSANLRDLDRAISDLTDFAHASGTP